MGARGRRPTEERAREPGAASERADASVEKSGVRSDREGACAWETRARLGVRKRRVGGTAQERASDTMIEAKG